VERREREGKRGFARAAAGGRSKEEHAREEDKGARDKRTEEKGEWISPRTDAQNQRTAGTYL
jgi:hypothetical protein